MLPLQFPSLPELVLTSDKASPMPPKAAAVTVVVLGHAIVGVEVVAEGTAEAPTWRVGAVVIGSLL